MEYDMRYADATFHLREDKVLSITLDNSPQKPEQPEKITILLAPEDYLDLVTAFTEFMVNTLNKLDSIPQ